MFKVKYVLIPVILFFVSCSSTDSGSNTDDGAGTNDTSGGTDDDGGNGIGLTSIVSTIYDNGVEEGTFTLFVENDQLISSINFDGGTSSVEYENGVVSKIRTLDMSGELDYDQFFDYDSQGRLIRYYSDPIDLRSDNVYEYSGDQVFLTVTWFDNSGNETDEQNYVLDTNASGLFVRQESDEGSVEEIEYDADGNPIRLTSTRPDGSNDYEIELTFSEEEAQDANQYFRFLFGNKYQTNGVLYNTLLNNSIDRISKNYLLQSQCVIGNCQLNIEVVQEFDNQGRIISETRTRISSGEVVEFTEYLYE